MKITKEFLRPDEVAKLLSISKRKVYYLIKDDTNPLPSKIIAGVIRIPSEGLLLYLNKCDNTPLKRQNS